MGLMHINELVEHDHSLKNVVAKARLIRWSRVQPSVSANQNHCVPPLLIINGIITLLLGTQ